MIGGDLYAGLMSGTSLDGVDAVLASFEQSGIRVLSHAHLPFPDALRVELLALCASGVGEVERIGTTSIALARQYARATSACLGVIEPSRVRAIGCHGQTIRHHPESGYTVQIGNPALLAELTGIAVVADFRSRDLAAGGQGAPLVPAFHAAAFSDPGEPRAVLNIGGIANLSLLIPGEPVRGFDTGPGNCLMDHWVQRHQGQPYDADGAWAGSGTVDPALLERLLSEPYFARPAPKSTGRELFNPLWLARHAVDTLPAADVQATLRELTVETVARALESLPRMPGRVVVCGGGAANTGLMARLAARLPASRVEPSTPHGMDPGSVEATAFAWLARQCLLGRPGNLPEVTGARGLRVLGAIYPA